MATLLASRLSEKKGMVIQTAILTLELLLLLTGLLSTFFMLKNFLSPTFLSNMVLGYLREFANLFRNFFSSPLYTCVLITSVVVLISIFSKFHHPTMDFLNIFQDEIIKDSEDLQSVDNKNDDHMTLQPAVQRLHEKEEHVVPYRTNSAIAIDTVMSFFSRYSHPVLDDIQDDHENHDDMPSVKDIEIDCVHKTSFPDISHLTQAREFNNPPLQRTSNINIKQQEVQRDLTSEVWRASNIQEMVDALEEVNMKQEEGEIIEDDDSLEATWKAITGGGNKKKKEKVLKKSETWPMEPQPAGVVSSTLSIGSKDLLPSVAEAWKDLRKSVTFNDSLSVFRRGGLRGDISFSQEESNKRFDDFIKKINYERMLQRQESDQRALKNMLHRAR